MVGTECRDPDSRANLGFYILDRLTPTETDDAERHLLSCESCQDHLVEISAVMPALRLLKTDDDSAAPAPTGSAPATAQPTGEHRTGGHPTPTRPTPTRPTPTRLATARPGGRTDRRGRRPTRLAVGLMLAVVVGSIAIAFVVSGTSPTEPTPTGVVASVDSGGVGLSATFTDSATVRVTVTGLTADTRYELFAVTAAGQTHRIAEFTGAPGRQEVTGDMPVSRDEVAFVAIRERGGAVVVTAQVSRN